MNKSQFDAQYYDAQVEGSIRSARAVLGVLFDMYQPARVTDVGCGRGGWLAVAGELGATALEGFDGPWTDEAKLVSHEIVFQTVDIGRGDRVCSSADLCISMEVAEHLPPSNAAGFIGTLCDVADVVLFSAAIPGQGGTGHINEQRQSYWAEKFAAHDYIQYDVLRPELWSKRDVEVWYRQNSFLFVKRGSTAIAPSVLEARLRPISDCVHPDLFEQKLRDLRAIAERKNERIEKPTGRFVAGTLVRYAKRLVSR